MPPPLRRVCRRRSPAMASDARYGVRRVSLRPAHCTPSACSACDYRASAYRDQTAENESEVPSDGGQSSCCPPAGVELVTVGSSLMLRLERLTEIVMSVAAQQLSHIEQVTQGTLERDKSQLISIAN